MLIKEIEPNQLALLSTLIAIELSENRTIDEINILGDILIAIGSIMITIGAQRESQQQDQQNEKDKNEHEELQKKIKKLEEQVEFLKNVQNHS